jgi:hypothetical protein
MTTRRSFLGSILAAGMAPAIVKAEILMPVRKIIVPPPIYRGEIGSLYGFSIISQDCVLDAQRYCTAAMREALDDTKFLIVHPNMYEQLLKGPA